MQINKNKEAALTVRKLKSVVQYDPTTGLFTWLTRPSIDGPSRRFNKLFAGKVAGSNKSGYIALQIDGVGYLAHRLAWLYMTGKWPSDQIDHKDRNPRNNSWSNLRAATCQQNQLNKGRMRTNRSGHTGVWWSARKEKWTAQVMRNGKSHYVGEFSDKDTAVAARASLLNKLSDGAIDPRVQP